MSSQDILDQARKLEPEERIQLVESLLNELDRADDAIDARWASEAEDRLAAQRRGELRAARVRRVAERGERHDRG